MIKVKETTAILILVLFTTGCITDMINDKEGWRDLSADFKSFYTIQEGGLIVNGRQLSAKESMAYTMQQRAIRGEVTVNEYENFLRATAGHKKRLHGEPSFYIKQGSMCAVPPRPEFGRPKSIARMNYEREVFGITGSGLFVP